jgi:hypothetical protein
MTYENPAPRRLRSVVAIPSRPEDLRVTLNRDRDRGGLEMDREQELEPGEVRERALPPEIEAALQRLKAADLTLDRMRDLYDVDFYLRTGYCSREWRTN